MLVFFGASAMTASLPEQGGTISTFGSRTIDMMAVVVVAARKMKFKVDWSLESGSEFEIGIRLKSPEHSKEIIFLNKFSGFSKLR